MKKIQKKEKNTKILDAELFRIALCVLSIAWLDGKTVKNG
jgi:hypothetical protein